MGVFRDPRPLIEKTPVIDTFVSDLGRIDILDGNARFVWFTEDVQEEGAPGIRVVRCKVVMPRSVIIPAVHRVLFAIGAEALRDWDLSKLRWQH